jgi:hypothetical protein
MYGGGGFGGGFRQQPPSYGGIGGGFGQPMPVRPQPMPPVKPQPMPIGRPRPIKRPMPGSFDPRRPALLREETKGPESLMRQRGGPIPLADQQMNYPF